MKSVMISIQPKWCELIASGKKTVEVRKTRPKIDTPFKCYIYCTNNKRQYLRKIETHCQKIFFTENRDVLGRTEKVKSLIGDVTTFWENGGYNGKVLGEFVCDCIANYEAELWDDETYERIQEFFEPDDFAEYGEYEYKTIADNGDDFWRENMLCSSSCITIEELRKYVGCGIATFYGWHISNLVIYDKPKELSEFYAECKMNCEHCEMWGSVRVNAEEFDMDCKSDWFNHKPLKRPPQSWCYVTEQ